MNKREFQYDDLVMSDEELAKVVNTQMEKLNPEIVIDMIIKIIAESDEEEPGIFKGAAPITKIAYIAQEMYKNGFLVTTYLMNETFKMCFGEESNIRRAGELHGQRENL